jgi:mannose-6-phosphate isomerase-like protein (cupin superfamily)
MKNRLMVITLCLALTPAAIAQVEKEMAELSIYSPADIVWKDGPSALPPGAKMARLEGDSAKEGFYTARLLFPAGYKIPPHTHPQTEHVTVISGALQIGMGEKFDQSASRTMPAGFLFCYASWNEAFCLDNGRDGHPSQRKWSPGHQLLKPRGRPSKRKEIAAFGEP